MEFLHLTWLKVDIFWFVREAAWIALKPSWIQNNGHRWSHLVYPSMITSHSFEVREVFTVNHFRSVHPLPWPHEQKGFIWEVFHSFSKATRRVRKGGGRHVKGWEGIRIILAQPEERTRMHLSIGTYLNLSVPQRCKVQSPFLTAIWAAQYHTCQCMIVSVWVSQCTSHNSVQDFKLS